MDRSVKGYTKPTTTLKDLNFLVAAERIEGFTAMGTALRLKLTSALRKDVEFLRSHNLMDYSLLLGIETSSTQTIETSKQSATFKLKQLTKERRITTTQDFEKIDIGEVFAENHRFKQGYKVFHVSIIDYLQEWNL